MITLKSCVKYLKQELLSRSVNTTDGLGHIKNSYEPFLVKVDQTVVCGIIRKHWIW